MRTLEQHVIRLLVRMHLAPLPALSYNTYAAAADVLDNHRPALWKMARMVGLRKVYVVSGGLRNYGYDGPGRPAP
jgi:hypothetical protein